MIVIRYSYTIQFFEITKFSSKDINVGLATYISIKLQSGLRISYSTLVKISYFKDFD